MRKCFSLFLFKILKLLKVSIVLIADLNLVQFLYSKLKELIGKQTDEISQLQNKIVKLPKLLTDRNLDILGKNEMIEKEFRLRDIKCV